MLKTVEARWSEHQAALKVNTGKWFKDFSKSMLERKEASKVALACNYVRRCNENHLAADEARYGLALELCNEIKTALKLSGLKAERAFLQSN